MQYYATDPSIRWPVLNEAYNCVRPFKVAGTLKPDLCCNASEYAWFNLINARNLVVVFDLAELNNRIATAFLLCFALTAASIAFR